MAGWINQFPQVPDLSLGKWRVSAPTTGDPLTRLLHDVCVLLMQEMWDEEQSLTGPLYIPEKMNVKLKHSCLPWPPSLHNQTLIRKSRFAPTTKEILLSSAKRMMLHILFLKQ